MLCIWCVCVMCVGLATFPILNTSSVYVRLSASIDFMVLFIAGVVFLFCFVFVRLAAVRACLMPLSICLYLFGHLSLIVLLLRLSSRGELMREHVETKMPTFCVGCVFSRVKYSLEFVWHPDRPTSIMFHWFVGMRNNNKMGRSTHALSISYLLWLLWPIPVALATEGDDVHRWTTHTHTRSLHRSTRSTMFHVHAERQMDLSFSFVLIP